MKIEKGIMIIKDEKAWGECSNPSGSSTCYGWVTLENGKIYNPKYLKTATDATYENSLDADILSEGTIQSVERKTEVIFVNNK